MNPESCASFSSTARSCFALAALLLVSLCGALFGQTPVQDPTAKDWTHVPGVEWEHAKPEALGYSSTRLEALRAWLKTQQTASMMVVVHRKVIFEYGDLSLVSKVASVRKSVLSMLYGNYVINGKIDTNKTVKELGLDDKQPFLPIEEHATLEQLMTARSGVYLSSGNRSLDTQTPKRGSE